MHVHHICALRGEGGDRETFCLTPSLTQYVYKVRSKFWNLPPPLGTDHCTWNGKKGTYDHIDVNG